MFRKDLVTMVDCDKTKTVEELELAFIPIWIRITKLPFGLMHRAMEEVIGGQVGEFMEMEKEDDSLAVGRYLCIKIRLDIRKPLMRGVTVCVEKKGEEDKLDWCPLVYEFLLDFCYTCGSISHIDKVCGVKL